MQSKEVEEFLKAEKTANELVETLEKLRSETISYQTAKNELDIVRQKLSDFVVKIGELATGSLEIIKTLKDIGCPKIIEKINQIETTFSEKLNSLDKNFQNKFSLQGSIIKKAYFLILISVLISLLSIILSIISLIK